MKKEYDKPPLSSIDISDDWLFHYGVKRRSGRYPWGSGEDPYQHSGDFLTRIENLHKKGMSEKEIADSLGMSTGELRTAKSNAKNEQRRLLVDAAKSLKADNIGATEIARQLSERFGRNINESTVRSWFNEDSEKRMNAAQNTANFLREQVKEKGMIDVGKGVELDLGVSKEKLNQALKILEEEGYPVYKGGIPNITNPGKQINQKVLCPPGTEHKEIYNYDQVHSIKEYSSKDGGVSFKKFEYPASMDSKRIYIRYDEDGGTQKDGIIELRRGVPDLDLGGSRYSQVRILVDGRKYVKGMAVYSDNIPEGYDMVVNSNKKRSQGMEKALKDIKSDPDNPFGASIKAAGQSYYDDPKGKFVDPVTGKRQSLSLINKTREEGDWSDWKDNLPAQFLSKQSLMMAKKQLGLAMADKDAEFDEIMNLTNPTVKKKLLQTFSEDCDSAAIHLKAAALPRQKYHVIVPINSLKDTEVYAPRYKDGEKLALIRYPHGGTFEIPILTVNNKNKDARQLLGTDASDVVGINHNVAGRLSGADFDGDTVMAIPTHDRQGKVKITSTDPLEDLVGFEPKDEYAIPEGNPNNVKIMRNTQNEMGRISNLITDMTLLGADPSELARAVRHSMVVIDAEKHKLDYKKSEIVNGIKELRERYQDGGASTIISRAKGQATVLKRQGTPKVNIKGKEWYDPNRPEGALIYKTADDLEYTYTKEYKNGTKKVITKQRTQKSTKMAETDDAYSLVSSSDTAMERLYAQYANHMKDLARKARLAQESAGKIAYSPLAKKQYSEEVHSLDLKLKKAQTNAPRERRAQLLANAEVKAKKLDNPDMSKDEIKKAGQQALSKYRSKLGASKENIKITDKEWEAIQAGAISESKLVSILNNTDKDNLRSLATPRTKKTLSEAKINQIKAMSNSNYTLAQIAEKLHLSSSTVSKALKGGI